MAEPFLILKEKILFLPPNILPESARSRQIFCQKPPDPNRVCCVPPYPAASYRKEKGLAEMSVYPRLPIFTFAIPLLVLLTLADPC